MIDLERCERAMQNVFVSGCPDRGRQSDHGGNGARERYRVIEEAIAGIQADPCLTMMGAFLATKIYAGFGDQRCDSQYGMTPRHGSIVFRVGRTEHARTNKVKLGSDEIYFLESARDFGSCFNEDKDKAPPLNLSAAIIALRRAEGRTAWLGVRLQGVDVDSHQNKDTGPRPPDGLRDSEGEPSHGKEDCK